MNQIKIGEYTNGKEILLNCKALDDQRTVPYYKELLDDDITEETRENIFYLIRTCSN